MGISVPVGLYMVNVYAIPDNEQMRGDYYNLHVLN